MSKIIELHRTDASGSAILINTGVIGVIQPAQVTGNEITTTIGTTIYVVESIEMIKELVKEDTPKG